MTGRGSTRGPDGELDADLERRLRAAFGGASAPEAPETVHAEVSRLVSAPKVRMRARVGGRLSVAFAAVGVGLFVVLVGSLPSIGSGPAPSASGDASASADDSVQPSVPSPSAAGSGACDVSPGTMHGTWWREIGGPNAFFNWGDGARVSQPFPWKLIVRFDPDAASTEEVSVWAERLDSGAREPGAFNSPIDPSTIYSFDTPAPDLSGGWYFFEQPLPTAGCWRLSAAIDGRLAGTSVVEVVEPDAPGTTGSPSIAPTPVVEPTPPPEPP